MEPEQHTYAVEMECRYLLRVPERIPGRPMVIAALHGYGMNAAEMLRLTERAVPESVVVASLQGPYQQFLSPDYRTAKIGYNWGTRENHPSHVALHHRMVRRLLLELAARFGVGPERLGLLGFSQAAGMNYRFAATYPGEVRGVIGICGGIPSDWEEEGLGYQPVTASLLHIARDQDEFYPLEVTAGFEERLRRRATDVEVCHLPGGHRFPSQARGLVGAWLERVCGR